MRGAKANDRRGGSPSSNRTCGLPTHPALGMPFFGLLHEVCHLVCMGKLTKP